MSDEIVSEKVQDLLRWWLPRIREVLDPHIRSIVLYGSVTLDDFMPGWSDVDVCVVLEQAVTEKQGTAIGQVHDEMRDRFVEQREGGWTSGQVIEGPYIPIGLATDPQAADLCYLAGGTTRKWARCNPITAFDRYMLSHFGVCWFGEPVPFIPPTRDRLIGQFQQDVRQLTSPSERCLNSAVWLTGIVHWIARSIVFWRDGVMMSKSAALEHEIEAGSPFAESFRLALRLRKEGCAATQVHLSILRNNFLAAAGPAADLLTQCISS